MSAQTRRRPGRPSLSNEALLDIALDLFLDQGFERTSIEAICAAASMAKRTVYARHGDKQALFKAALTRAISLWIVPIDRLRAAETDDLEASLLAIGEILVSNIMSPAGLRLMRLTNAVSGSMPEIGAYNVMAGTQPTIDYLANLFARRIAPLGSGAAVLSGQAFLNLVPGPAVSAEWGVTADPHAIEQHTKHAVRLFLHGMLANDQPCDGALEEENRRLRKVLAETARTLEAVGRRLT